MKLQLVKGATSQTINLFILDSSSTTGAGKTGLAFNTSSLTAYYTRPAVAAAAITLATQTTTGAWSSGGFVEIDATNMPGWYRFDVPNAVLAAGKDCAQVHLKGAAGMVPLPLEIQLTTINVNDANAGLTNLDAAISTRSTYSGGAVASVTGAVGSVTASVTVGTNSDKTGYALSSGGVQAIWDALTSALTTSGSIGKAIIDNLTSTYFTTALSEPTSVPAANAGLTAKINYLFQYFRNKRTVTATVETLYRDDGSTTVGSAVLSDDSTTFSKGEIS